MTIQEAIQSGRPFKRIGWGDDLWAIVDWDDNDWVYPDGSGGVYFHPDELKPHDVLATDWEVKE